MLEFAVRNIGRIRQQVAEFLDKELAADHGLIILRGHPQPGKHDGIFALGILEVVDALYRPGDLLITDGQTVLLGKLAQHDLIGHLRGDSLRCTLQETLLEVLAQHALDLLGVEPVLEAIGPRRKAVAPDLNGKVPTEKGIAALFHILAAAPDGEHGQDEGQNHDPEE